MTETKTQHCECGSRHYHIKWKLEGSGVRTWAECVDCGRPTRSVGDGIEMQWRWLNG